MHEYALCLGRIEPAWEMADIVLSGDKGKRQ
jgi:hypothetical protein